MIETNKPEELITWTKCNHSNTFLYGNKCIICDRAETMKESIEILNKAFKGCSLFCIYEKCIVRHFEHYHIDEHTLTFTPPIRTIDNDKCVS